VGKREEQLAAALQRAAARLRDEHGDTFIADDLDSLVRYTFAGVKSHRDESDVTSRRA
jgi:hypothetical protein